MNTTKHTIYLVIQRNKQSWWKKSRIVRMALKEPKLTNEQLAIPLEIEIPDSLLEATPVLKISVNGENLIRPEVKVSQI